MKTALLTGSFDPITFGHLDIFHRAANAFARVIIGVGNNPKKKYLFTQEERAELIKANLKAPNIEVITLGHRLTADVAYESDAIIIKGVRMDGADFDYERMMHDINRAHQSGLDTFILPCAPHLHWISSSAAKEVCEMHGITEAFVPLGVKEMLEHRITGQMKVGFTGPIASGKSMVADELIKLSSPELPIHNVDLDKMAHDILFQRNEPAYLNLQQKLKENLGLSEWTRKAVGQLIFGNEEARKLLNKEMEQPLRTRLRTELAGKKGIVLLNGALLIEAGWAKLVNNRFVVLDVNPANQEARLMARGHSPQQCKHRLNTQFKTEAKLARLKGCIAQENYGQYVRLSTDGDLSEVVQTIHNTLKSWWAETAGIQDC